MSSDTVISYPIPPFQNLPIHAEFYQPRRFVISAIILGETTLVTTTLNHDYVIGQLTRLIIPPANGSRQLNQREGYVISIPMDNQVVLEIDSQGSDPFVIASSQQEPQILAIGDINTGQINSNGRKNNLTYIPGSFINISP